MHLGIIGYGNIAATLLDLMRDDPLDRLTLLSRPGTAARAAGIVPDPTADKARILDDPAKFIAARPDLVVECAGHGAVRDILPAVLQAGIDTLIVSVGALADDDLRDRLYRAAAAGGARIILPSGAIGGLDLLTAVAQAGDLTVRYRGTKPPAAWKGTPAEAVVDLDTLAAPMTFFSGTARQAALTYPKNANVAATLALAGAGLDRTQVDLIADPDASGNVHAYDVVSPICRYSIRIHNPASAANAKTSISTVYSVLSEVRAYRTP